MRDLVRESVRQLAGVQLHHIGRQLSGRIDYVFDRGFSSIDSAFLVGNTPFENVRPRWASDHAGVVATVVDLPEPSAGALFAAAIFLLGMIRLRAHG